MTGSIHKDQIGATKESFPLFRCPECKKTGLIDDDQFHGRVSIVCVVTHGCDYHETKDWSIHVQDSKKV